MGLDLALIVLVAATAQAPAELPLPVAHRTETVAVRTDLDAAWAKDIAAAIETQRDALVRELGPLLGVRKKPRPLTLLAFRSSAAYRKYAAKASPAHVLSLGWYDPERTLAVTHTETRFTALHEASHWVLREVLMLPGRDDLPVWVVEGIPCLAEAADDEGLSGYRLHRLPTISKANLRIGLSALQADLGAGSDDAFYAAGWLEAHYLRTKRPKVYRAYLTAVKPRGALPDLAKLAGTSRSALEKDILDHAAELPRVAHAEAARRFPSLVPDGDRPASDAEVFRQVEFLRFPDKAVQHVAMRWFANHEHPTIAPRLLAILPDESARIRLYACSQILRTAPKKAAPTLVALLEAEDPAIRMGALRALSRLNHSRTLGFANHDEKARAASIVRWKKWLETYT